MSDSVSNGKTSNPILRIDRMRLENFRCFKELDITFDPRLTVIVAPNGGGKTAVLDAVAVALGPFVQSFQMHAPQKLSEKANFSTSDARQISKPGKLIKEEEQQQSLKQAVWGFFDGEERIWDRELVLVGDLFSRNTRHLFLFGNKLKQAVSDVAAGEGPEVELPLVSYYGTGRLWLEKRLSPDLSTETSRTVGYKDCFDSASRYAVFVEWLQRICWAEYQERDNPAALNEITAMLSAVRNAVDCVMKPTGWHGITISSGKGMSVVAEHDQHGQLPVHLLSDGIRNTIALTADIAHRAVRLNSHLGADAARLTPGIVLIDEVDMHLHPEWQQTVLGSLLEAFPCIQFIVTTHSPQVLTTVRSENIRVLTLDEDGVGLAVSPPFNTYAEESRITLEDVMGTSSRPPVGIVDELKNYQRLVAAGKYDDPQALELRARLEESYGSDHIEFQLADMDIRRQEAIKAAGNK